MPAIAHQNQASKIMTRDDQWHIKPDRLPQKIELETTPEIASLLRDIAAESGRSVDEIILEILDRELQKSD